MTVRLIPPVDAIGDVLALDEALAEEQERHQRAHTFTPQSEAYRGALHGFATDLRERIAAWVEEAREDAARVAEEDRHG